VDWRRRLAELEDSDGVEGGVATMALAVLGPTFALTLAECVGGLAFTHVGAMREGHIGGPFLAFGQFLLFPLAMMLVVSPVWRGGRTERLALVPGVLIMSLVALHLPAAWAWQGLGLKPSHPLVRTLVPLALGLAVVPVFGTRIGSVSDARLRLSVSAGASCAALALCASTGAVLPDLVAPTGRYLLLALFLILSLLAVTSDTFGQSD
jgi:hypothetical protein